MSDETVMVTLEAPDADVVIHAGINTIAVRAGQEKQIPTRFTQAALAAGLSPKLTSEGGKKAAAAARKKAAAATKAREEAEAKEAAETKAALEDEAAAAVDEAEEAALNAVAAQKTEKTKG